MIGCGQYRGGGVKDNAWDLGLDNCANDGVMVEIGIIGRGKTR